MEQFIRDIKPNSIWELTTGIHSLIFVAQTMPANEGQNFGELLGKMGKVLERYSTLDAIRDLAQDVGQKVQLLGETATFFGQCAAFFKI